MPPPPVFHGMLRPCLRFRHGVVDTHLSCELVGLEIGLEICLLCGSNLKKKKQLYEFKIGLHTSIFIIIITLNGISKCMK